MDIIFAAKLYGMSLNKNNFLIIFLWFITLQGFAQITDSLPAQHLDEVIVTATRTQRQLSSLPMPVTLISKQQITETGVTRLDDILQEQTGIILAADPTIGGGEGIQLQGIAADYILVLIDGVPLVGRSSGNLDLSRVAIGNIQQVEIVKGPSSSLFGSEALGGVINIITEEPKQEGISGQISHRIASFNDQNSQVRINQRQGNIRYALFADRLSNDGYDLAPQQSGQTNNPLFNYTLNGRIYADFSEKIEVYASARYFFQDFDIDPGISQETDTNFHLRTTHTPDDATDFQYEVYYTNYLTREQVVNALDPDQFFENDFDQKLFRPEVRFTKRWMANTASFGAGLNVERLSRSLFQGEVRFNSQYVFGQYDFKPLNGLNVIAGARFDHHSEYNAQLSPKLSARYQLNPRLALKGSVGSGFKAPDFRQLFLDFTNAAAGGYSVLGKNVEQQGISRLQQADAIATLLVDPDGLGQPLDAESSVGYNLGMDFREGSFSMELNLFHNTINNLIDTRILATKRNGQNVFGYINRNRVITQGLELDFRYRLTPEIRLAAGYQLLYAYDKQFLEDIEAGTVFARQPGTLETIKLDRSAYFGLENRSRHNLNFKMFYEVPEWDANANLRVVYRSRFGLTDRNGNGLLDVYDNSYIKGYALVNLALEKTFLNKYQVQAGAENLLDFRGANPLAAQDEELLLNPGRQLFTRLTIQF